MCLFGYISSSLKKEMISKNLQKSPNVSNEKYINRKMEKRKSIMRRPNKSSHILLYS